MGYIKIQTGDLKNKKIFIIDNKNLKPILSRIKYIIFSLIKNDINNAICLDCFAGSGSLSIEALSNNAKKIICIENNKQIYIQLLKNIKKIKFKNIFVFNENIFNYLKNVKLKFNIIFIDPPLKSNYINKIINIIIKKKILNKNSYIFIQTLNKNIILIPNNWIIIKQIIRKYIKYILFKNI